jgi:glucan phosphorylase
VVFVELGSGPALYPPEPGPLGKDVPEPGPDAWDHFLANVKRVHENLLDYLGTPGWFRETHGEEKDFLVAYFSCEFGLEEGLPIYAGGLGLLAGDHLKAASDLGLPLVGVGLLYQKGYFRQVLSLDGWQKEFYPDNDWYNMPVSIQRDSQGSQIMIEVNMAGEKVKARIWRAQIGRTPLYLLDSNIKENSPRGREITGTLYGGDRDMRIRQEILLGVGGVRAMRALGLSPTVYHMNEGHSAFLAIERIRKRGSMCSPPTSSPPTRRCRRETSSSARNWSGSISTRWWTRSGCLGRRSSRWGSWRRADPPISD